MSELTPWRELREFHDSTVAKLDNLRRAAEAGIRVPPTWWLPPHEIGATTTRPEALQDVTVIVRSGSAGEDGHETSNAGQFLSLVVPAGEQLADAINAVRASFTVSGTGGVVFIQPYVEGREAGVCFFDGYYFERTADRVSNMDLTAGNARGEVSRSHLRRDDHWSRWLESLYSVFGPPAGGSRSIDIEFVRDDTGYVLLQCRPALFEISRNETVSLANHREILGDLPSPWMTSVLVEAGRRAVAYFAEVDPAVAEWNEDYAIELAGRPWMNFSLFFHLMDRWGLPRTMVTQGVGGDQGTAADRRVIAARFVRSIPRLIQLQAKSLSVIRGSAKSLRGLAYAIERANGLEELFAVTVDGLETALRTNFALGSVLTGMARIRKTLRIPLSASVVTRDMMNDYERIRSRPVHMRSNLLKDWLHLYGHRGPLESDLAHPRFSEMRELLLNDLMHPADSRAAPPTARPPMGIMPKTSGEFPTTPFGARIPTTTRPGSAWFAPFSVFDVRREWFRDELMRCWQRLRERLLLQGELLAEQGRLDCAADVFWLRGSDITPSGPLKDAVCANRKHHEAVRGLALPLTSTRDEIAALESAKNVEQISDADSTDKTAFPGISLYSKCVEGAALKARDLAELLSRVHAGAELSRDRTILVVPALEPAWAVVFPRVLGVVAEIGGELSHASILLREARKPAIVNCTGIFSVVKDGDRLRLDGVHGIVERLS